MHGHPLRVGLSVNVRADVRDESGSLVTAKVGPGTTSAQTGEDNSAAIEALIARILRNNGAEDR